MAIAERPARFRGVRGPDAEDFLQRMLSNDVAQAPCDALLLTAKGRIIAPLRDPPPRRRRLPAPDRARARRDCSERAAPSALRGEVRDRARGAHVRRSSGTGTSRAPTSRWMRRSSRRPARRSSSVPASRQASRRGGRRSTSPSFPPRRVSTARTSPSPRGATPARNRSPGCTTAGTRTAVCACCAWTRTRGRSSATRARSVGRVTSAVPGVALAYVRAEVPADAELEIA